MPHACSLFLVGLVVGYTLRGLLDDINKALLKEYSIVDGR
jgi:hypothetical protein